MLSKIISSVQNPLVKLVYKIRTDKKTREKEGRVLVTGRKEILEISKKISFLQVFALESEEMFLENTIFCTENVLAKISGIKNSEPCALFPLPEDKNLLKKNTIVVLDHIQDPGNLGTLIRTAYALGFEGMILIGTVDPFNDKAVRASKGACFLLPLQKANEEQMIKIAKEKKLYVADVKGKKCFGTDFQKPFLLLLGHETKGPSSWTDSYEKITIPMNEQFDSLNVASAGAILMYEMMGKKI